MMAEGLSGRVALVTGGGSGIGEACVKRLAEQVMSVNVDSYSDDLGRIDGRWVFTRRRISIAFDREASGVG